MVINGDPKGNNMLYCNGKAVIIRDISVSNFILTIYGHVFNQNPSIADTYTQHSCQATVAQYAPSGYYIASGGTVINTLLVTQTVYRCFW